MSYGLIIRDGANIPRTVTSIQVRDVTNTARSLSEIRVRDSNNVSRLVFSLVPPLSAEAVPSSVFGYSSTGTATTITTTVTPTGGLPPYTYDWTLIFYNNIAAIPTVSSSTSQVVDFTQTSISPGESFYAQWQCAVTDANGSIATADCLSSWSYI